MINRPPLRPGRRNLETAVFQAGALAGLIAGSVMLLVAMIREEATNGSFFDPARWIAASIFQNEALGGGAFVIVTGLIIHFILSAIFGFVFAALLRRSTLMSTATWGGMLYSFGIWVVMTFVALPLFDPLMFDRVRGALPSQWFLYHMVYGATLGITPGLRRRLLRSTDQESASARDQAA